MPVAQSVLTESNKCPALAPGAVATFATALEFRWLEVRTEFLQLGENALAEWPERELYNRGWEVFGLFFFGEKFAENCQRCPATTELVEAIPGMTTAGFSVLGSGTHIRPHTGYTSAVLRLHLGLIVPENCGLRVGNETLAWQEGKCLIFDDTIEHEAWNHSDRPRVVLLVDFRRDAVNA